MKKYFPLFLGGFLFVCLEGLLIKVAFILSGAHFYVLDQHETFLFEESVQKIDRCVKKLWFFDKKLKVQACVHKNQHIPICIFVRNIQSPSLKFSYVIQLQQTKAKDDGVEKSYRKREKKQSAAKVR